MSKYTTQVRNICENIRHNLTATQADIEEIIEVSYPIIFNFKLPLDDAVHSKELCKKILRHYYTREIGRETVGEWKLRMRIKLLEILPYYNVLYSQKIENTNIHNQVELYKEYERKSSGSSQNDDLYSETPQGGLTGLSDMEYLTTANRQIQNGESGEKYNEIYRGLDGSKSIVELYKELQDYYKDIDLLIIEELEPLFLQIW